MVRLKGAADAFAAPGWAALLLIWLGVGPERLPVRTRFVVAGPYAVDPAGPYPVESVADSRAALFAACRALERGEADTVVAVGLHEPQPGAVAAVVLRRSVEALAEGERVLGLLRACSWPPAVPEGEPVSAISDLRPLFGWGAWPADAVLRPGPEPTDGRAVLLMPPGERLSRSPGVGPYLHAWSAQDADAEERMRDEVLRALESTGERPVPLPELFGQPVEPVRGCLVAASREEVVAALRTGDPVLRGTVTERRGVALLFPGQGSQYPRMGAGLYGHEPVFTAAVDAVLLLLEDGERVRDVWLSGEPVDATEYSQPLLFAVGYAMGRLVMSWGVRPNALLGHSIGEMVAATLAGVFTLPDAVRLVRERVELVADAPPGGMLAVAAAADRLAPYLVGDVVVGAVNSSRQCLLAGPDAELAKVAGALEDDGITCRPARSHKAFHSPALAPYAAASTPSFAAVRRNLPSIPVHSAAGGGPLTAEQVADPAFWAGQLAGPVLFGPALNRLLADGDHLLVEAGPGQGLAALARRHPAVRSGRSAVTALLPTRPGTPEDDRRALLSGAGRLWVEGHDLDRDALQPPK
ncbi:acyltransferase domain-containing protein [Kitasatospora sp. NPDC058032]|uniref:acyltransferase domain-containing protein n=1 Tax=unclassified Kitasatospora TaxID=2633591 RepID=UPI00339F42C8